MPKLILRCNYLKNAPPSHLTNYMNYISTREGVEKIDNTCGLLPATVKQKELIADILSKIEDADRIPICLEVCRHRQQAVLLIFLTMRQSKMAVMENC